LPCHPPFPSFFPFPLVYDPPPSKKVAARAEEKPHLTLDHRPVEVELIVFGSEMGLEDVGPRHSHMNFDLGRYDRFLGGVGYEVVGEAFEATFVIGVGFDDACLPPSALTRNQRRNVD
jgi:hypothetical protein